MMRRVAVHRDASAEADAAASRYEYERVGLGLQFTAELEKLISDLREGTLPGLPWRGPLAARGIKYTLLKRFPFKVVFVDHSGGILILAIAHHARRPGYWRERLRS